MFTHIFGLPSCVDGSEICSSVTGLEISYTTLMVLQIRLLFHLSGPLSERKDRSVNDRWGGMHDNGTQGAITQKASSAVIAL